MTTAIPTTTPGRRPSISGDLVAFERTMPLTDTVNTSVVVLHDMATGEKVIPLSPADAINQRRPHVNGDWLVFDAFVGGRPVRDLVLYQVSTGAIQHIARDGNQSYARISGTWVTFDDDTGSISDIIIPDMVSGRFQRITLESQVVV